MITTETEELKDGYILDYISGEKVKATPEEIEAVQVFSKILVEDYNYPKSQIQTRPQYRVKIRPSDVKKEYPIDIAIFNATEHTEDNIQIIVECKKKNRKDGRSQLEDYLRFSKANLGVWFNGEERFFIRKIEKNGNVIFNEIPNIPKFGQRIEDIGLFKRKDLKPTHNLKSTFKAIRNHLAANAVAATRDEALAQQLINLIFCKIYDEKWTKPNDMVQFRVGIDENPQEVQKRILELFESVKYKYKEVFEQNDSISLDANSIVYIVGELQNYCVIEAERDVIADAFETFIGHALKGGQGQFFTPRNVVKMMVDILNPDENDTVLDPACGSGGFIIEALRHIWNQLEEKAKELKMSGENLREEQIDRANTCIRGIDKDSFLAKIAKAYMAIMGDGKSGVVNEDSLEQLENWKTISKTKIHLNDFSVILTNPPFGSKIPVSGATKLAQYELAHKWKQDKKTGDWEKGKLADKEAPQILFIERCLQFLRVGGRMAVVLPDGIFGNNKLGYIRRFIMKQARIVAVIDIPLETFMPNTGTKTSILIVQKLPPDQIPEDYPVFMCVAETCGHDRRGNIKEEDDISEIATEFKKWAKEHNFSFTKNGK
ncbi:MAG: N-6 DNA methylase [Chitinophagaceae bacterium]|nr:N-6 DNA methylase [Chitinophagaceae bacterium]